MLTVSMHARRPKGGGVEMFANSNAQRDPVTETWIMIMIIECTTQNK